MPIELPAIAYSEQRMKESRIPNVNLREFYHPFIGVRVPGLKHTHDQRAGQSVEMPFGCRMSLAQGSPNLRAVSDTPPE